jgi:hypothetical protein
VGLGGRAGPDGRVRLIAVDIDGTLLDSRARLPDAHRDALVDASAEGVEIVLATGRSFVFARPIADLFPIPLTLIVNNGAVVKNKAGVTAMRHVLSRDAARVVLDAAKGHEENVALVFDRESIDDRRQTVYERMDWSLPNRRGYYEKNKAFIAPSDGPLASALSEDPIQVMFNGGVAPMRTLAGVLRGLSVAEHISVAVTEYVARDFSLVDVNGAGCSKGSTLARWVAARGWSSADVAAIGDNLNDVEMLDFAGAAFVMGNAADSLKSRGYRLTGSHDEGGVADAVRRCLTSPFG